MKSWMTLIGILLVPWCASVAEGNLPDQDGITFESPVSAVQVAGDNSRAVIWLEASNGIKARLVVLDTHDPQRIVRHGEVVTDDSGALSVSPDGLLAVTAAALEKPKYDTATN